MLLFIYLFTHKVRDCSCLLRNLKLRKQHNITMFWVEIEMMVSAYSYCQFLLWCILLLIYGLLSIDYP